MIHEVDLCLRRLVRDDPLLSGEADVAFEAPTKEWASRRNAPTVNVYLYDVREDLRRRTRGLQNEYVNGVVTARHLPPRYFKLSYLVSAWTQRPEDEHRLLSSLLSRFLRYEAIPPELLEGTLAALALPIPMTVALPPPEDRAFADVWTALGGELKPSLDVVVSAPMETGRVFPAGPPAHEGVRLNVNGDSAVGHNVPEDATPDQPLERVAMTRVRREAQ
ncbi:DUF4255 domain-containing protein [Actinokineospora inagensis]|uniref:DUF4255 domain-containing protein n=1 Tax=Actinokineospora inagensis TaxID=103730 RepID=UPI000424A768|nr:DUF4255 domain-containing protein [Actinokineospora inagensis]